MPAQSVCDMLQKQIPHVPSERVVNDTELFDIDDRNGETTLIICSTCQEPPHALAKQRAFRETGVRIEVGQKAHGAVLL